LQRTNDPCGVFGGPFPLPGLRNLFRPAAMQRTLDQAQQLGVIPTALDINTCPGTGSD